MNFTVIDSDNYAASGIEAFFFPGGEPHVKIPEFPMGNYLLFLKLRTWNDVGIAVMLFDAIFQQREGQEPDFRSNFTAFVPYFPGARQDRSDGRTPITKDVIGMLLSYGDIPLHVFDVHSQEGYVEVTKNWMPADLGVRDLPPYEYIIAPDAGAVGRAKSMAHALGCNSVIVQAEKVREFATGKITSYTLPPFRADEIFMGKHPGANRALVVDDICDGGATFNILADSVPEGVELDLWVSHGIFSKGLDAISHRYKTIYTTDSFFRGVSGGSIGVLQLKHLFNKIMES